MKKLTQEQFIEKSNVVHNFKYNYDKSIYINCRTKILITCKKHGDFFQTPHSHIDGKQGCKKCGYEKISKEQALTVEEFIKKANDIHKNTYEYINIKYVNTKTKISIICKEHGVFFQTPSDHFRREGCPKCGLKTVISKLTGLDFEVYEKTLSEYIKYQKKVIKITNRQPIKDLLNYDKRGNSGVEGAYHLDHKFSISEGFKQNVAPEIIGNINNLEFLPWIDNQKKQNKCSITLEHLITLINSQSQYQNEEKD